MKEEIIKITEKLKNDEITENDAQKQFLFLFGVSESLTEDEIDETAFKYGKKLDEGFNYYIDRTYDILHFKRGLKKAMDLVFKNS